MSYDACSPGTLRISDLEKSVDPLGLASTFVDAFLNKDALYPDVSKMLSSTLLLPLIHNNKTNVNFRGFLANIYLPVPWAKRAFRKDRHH